jgi:hypothetical protein
MKISWNTIGNFAKAGTALFPIGAVLFLLKGRVGGNFATIALAVVWLALIVIGIVCGSVALLYYAGVLKIACPLCKRPGSLISRGRYTHLHCDSCGDVHARGFFRSTYERR